MQIQKFILCVAVALTAFGASLGLLEIGNYIRTAFEPLKVEIKPLELIQPTYYFPPQIPDFQQPAVVPTEESEPEEEPEDWGKTGDYYIIGERPKGFEDFEFLIVNTHKWDDKNDKVVAVKPNGELRMEKEFNFSWLNITGKRISLGTRERKGISYRFDGRFIKAQEVKYESEDGEEYTDEAFLKGRLTKWRNGIKIAEAKVKLGIYHGC